MTGTMNITLTTLRARVQTLRVAFQQATAQGSSARRVQARLSYLVPLYKAMHAAVQQAGTDTGGGVKKYLLEFEEFGRLIRKVMPHQSDFEKYFEGDVGNIEILVPVAGVAVEDWKATPISALVDQAVQEAQAERMRKANLARAAKEAHTAFVRSLNAEQRVLLGQALEAAKANRSNVVQLELRDLDIK